MEKNGILNIRELTKEYGTHRAVDRVSFSLKEGEIIGLLGPNGAGKTTIINMILGILEPTEGTIEVLGRTLKKDSAAIKKRMNFAAVYAHMPANLTVRQSLIVFGLLYEVKNLKERISYLLNEFDLVELADKKTGVLSSGEMSRLSLAKALINEPCLLLLDEPTASLDPSVSRLIRDKIKAYSERTGAAILWTSHNMNEIEAVCDEVLFLSRGRILLKGNPKTLPMEYGERNLEELFIAVAREPLSLWEG
ncbi:MAG: ABC transporter ATP-binding protein [Syntrophorhabdaceae bacterium]|nr:ABC transporter ATP-binding protein [Syntrophorhabdaceae bacterium]